MDICQRIFTTRDTNGNARAIWLAYSIWESRTFNPVGQGYLETGGYRPPQLLGWHSLQDLEVTPRQYQAIIRDLKSEDKLTP